MTSKDYNTVLKEGHDITHIEKSKFLGYCRPVDTVEEAEAFIATIKKKHYDATHNVPVYVIGKNYEVQKYSDDGEPSGTAGLPVLEMLKKEKITNLVIVMTRYYGGIKLGTGGLVRAYTEIAKLTLKSSEIVARREKIKRLVALDYTLHGKVQNALMNHPSVLLGETIFDAAVTMTLYFSPESQKEIEELLVDLTNDRIIFKDFQEVFTTEKNGVILSIE